jgi:hypothetical protein
MHPLQAYSMALIMQQADVPIHIHSFASHIKVSLVTGNPLFCKREPSILGFLPFLGPEKTLFVRHENIFFLYFANEVHMPNSL